MIHKLSVREIQQQDIPMLLRYWYESPPEFLQSLGVDLKKIPARTDFESMLLEQLDQDYPQKKAYCIIWLHEGKACGHSNVNKITFGKEAHMHLHIWNSGFRQKGAGTQFVKITLPFFFKNLQLKKVICEPYALNEAPNRTLAKTGFQFVKEYITVPGLINFEQPVKSWELTVSSFQAIFSDGR